MRSNALPAVKRGDTWNFVFSWKNNNIPTNLTDCQARMQIREKRTGELMGEVSTANLSIIIEGIVGKVNVSFPSSITALIPPGTYETDLEITFPVTGQVQSSGTLQIVVDEDITR